MATLDLDPGSRDAETSPGMAEAPGSALFGSEDGGVPRERTLQWSGQEDPGSGRWGVVLVCAEWGTSRMIRSPMTLPGHWAPSAYVQDDAEGSEGGIAYRAGVAG